DNYHDFVPNRALGPHLNPAPRRYDLRSRALPARGVQGVVDDKFPLENLVIAQTESPESRSNPAKTFSCRMRIVRMRIGRTDNLTEKDQGRVGEVVFLQN